MKTIRELRRLTPGELLRVRRTLLRRFRRLDPGNVLEIGFGVARRDGRDDPSRDQAVSVIVRDKRRPRTGAARIPASVRIRLRRGAGFVVAELATDVVSRQWEDWVPTRRPVRHLSGRQTAAATALVAWDDSQGPAWGLLTVGHAFAHVRHVPESAARVRVLVPGDGRDHGERELGGRLLARSRSRDRHRVDAALVLVKQEHLVVAGWAERAEESLPSPHGSPGVSPRTTADLARDLGRPGQAITPTGDHPFVVRRYFPEFRLIPQVGPIRDVLEVESPTPGAFAPGGSGSAWTIGGEPACLQFAGWMHPTDPAQSYRRGLGQPVVNVIDWGRAEIAASRAADPSSPVSLSSPLRLVRLV